MARSRWLGALACTAVACGPALPHDLRLLDERSERIEVRYEAPTRVQRPFAQGVLDFGAFQLSAKRLPSETDSRSEVHVVERGRSIATLVCTSQISGLKSDPPQNLVWVSCKDRESSWSLDIDLSNGVAIRAQDRAGHCFVPRWPERFSPYPTDRDSGVVTVYECGERDEYNQPAAGRLAAVVWVTGGKVFLLVPPRDPERSAVLAAFLITLASQPLWAVRNAPLMARTGGF